MKQYIHIGSSPAGEDCAQVGAANYHALSKLELAAFKKGLEEKFPPPDGAYLGIKEGEVVAFYDDKNKKAVEYAFHLEANTPETWEELGMKAPRLDDPAFTETDLIPVPNATATESEREQIKRGFLKPGHILESGFKVEKVKTRWVGEVKNCDLMLEQMMKSPNCIGAIKNEFMDGRMKIGQWAIMCPACFGLNGVGLGEGLGQRYHKATDGNFYKVEG